MAVVLSLPFTGLWRARNSPAHRVPSHGVDVLGERYAIDFIGVDERHRTALRRDWRTLVATEPPDRFVAFGRPILAPCDGVVVVAHDGEDDHAARRSPLALVPYALTQAGRLRDGVGAVAGNHVIICMADARAFVAMVHLQRGSLRVCAGDSVVTGEPVAACGNSGNSTQPHVHVQAMDSADLSVAQGVPVAFRSYREWASGEDRPVIRESGIPGEDSVVEPVR